MRCDISTRDPSNVFHVDRILYNISGRVVLCKQTCCGVIERESNFMYRIVMKEKILQLKGLFHIRKIIKTFLRIKGNYHVIIYAWK